MSTKLVAEQFEISRRRVQQLEKRYRDTGIIPEFETPGRKPYATRPDDLLTEHNKVTEIMNKKDRQHTWWGSIVITRSSRFKYTGIRAYAFIGSSQPKMMPRRTSIDMVETEDNCLCLNQEFERHLHKHNIEHSLCEVSRPQTNVKIKRFFQTYEKHRFRFDTFEVSLQFYNGFDSTLVCFGTSSIPQQKI